MKIRIFDSTYCGVPHQEDAVNEFIKDKKVIQLLQSECVGDGEFSRTITVLYEEKK